MLALFPLAAALCLASLNAVPVAAQISIPGLTDGQQTCLANCIFAGLPAATGCDATSDNPDVACFCASTAYTTNVTQCATTTCSVCTSGACNITANPLVDQCGSAAVSGSGSASGGASASQTPAAPSGSASPSAGSKSSGSGSTPSGSGSTSGSGSSSGSAPAPSKTANSALNTGRVTGAAIFTAGLMLVGLVV
ncbi:hypothetical protein C8R44DRAFT_805652 [Mycena epipterygia]|nr:hypothetical protein C8R44DRAFT_805652 [Mycena epipterygia]